jgi:hypothetical protein
MIGIAEEDRAGDEGRQRHEETVARRVGPARTPVLPWTRTSGRHGQPAHIMRTWRT